MKSRLLLISLFICFVLLPSLATASSWILFSAKQQNGTSWYYDKDSIAYFKAKSIIGVEIPKKDRNYQKVWIKSAGDMGERLFLVELNCKEHTARLQDDNNKVLYNEPSIDYLYDRPIPPDSVLDKLQKAVCAK